MAPLLRTTALASIAALGGCADDVTSTSGQGGGGGTDAVMTSSSTTAGTATTAPGTTTNAEATDTGVDSTGDVPPEPDCEDDGSCTQIDVLLVIDNSSTMAGEQINMAANLGRLVEKLQGLEDAEGNSLNPSVNVMVTNTDAGSCGSAETSQAGAPIYEGCNARIADFTGTGDDPQVVEEGCTQYCPQDVVPTQHFIHFDARSTNVPDNDVAGALRCIGPQGIRGCEYEAPLEAMLGALDPSACWNDPQQDRCQSDPQWASSTQGFLRDDATLVVMIIADEADCSAPPRSATYFTDDDTYWATNPDTMLPEPSSAICWNAGASCVHGGEPGVYDSCGSDDSPGVLHPVERYTSYLRQLREGGKDVFMFGALGVPPVTAHNQNAPFEPVEGGLFDLVYRDWLEEDVMNGDTVERKRFEFGAIAPGCTQVDDDGTRQALPPTRVRDVCESANFTDEDGSTRIRCCIESLCSTDFSAAIQCLSSPGALGPPSG